MSNLKRKPGRPSLSEDQKQEIRNDIIEIARELFVNEGYESTSMRKIAAQAGFAPTKIYYYFENKKSILRHFWQDISEDMWEYCKPPQYVIEEGPLQTIHFLMNKNVRYWLENPKSFQLGIATQDYKADVSENFDIYCAMGTRAYIDLMHNCVQSCLDQGIFRGNNATVISQIIGMAVYGIYGAYYNLPMVAWEKSDEIINEAINNALRGLQTSEELACA